MKIGDKVKIIHRKPDNRTGGFDYNLPNGDGGKEGTISGKEGDSFVVLDNKFLGEGNRGYLGWFEGGIEIILINQENNYEIY